MCSLEDDVIITNNSVTADAGPDQEVCATVTNFAAVNPGVGTGNWTTVIGAGTIGDNSSRTSLVTALGAGLNSFRWTVTGLTGCFDADDVDITNLIPTAANVGDDDEICNDSYTITSNTPVIGTGSWSTTGVVVLSNSTSNSLLVSGLSLGDNVFIWTIDNNGCTTDDTITILRNTVIAQVEAGQDEIVCSTDAELRAISPAWGTGSWTRVSGIGTVDNSTATITDVSGLGVGPNVFRWRVDAGICTDFEDVVKTNNTFTILDKADVDVCAPNVNIVGEDPLAGNTGVWTIVSGGGTIDNSTDFDIDITSLQHSPTINTFRWTVTRNGCSAFDDITVMNYTVIADAGSTPLLNCAATNALNAVPPQVGETGNWTTIVGTGTPSTPTLYNSAVTNLSPGTNTFRWTITAVGGDDQEICDVTTTILTANNPTEGTGSWSIVSGAGAITNSTSNNTNVTGVTDATVFRWTIEKNGCTTIDDVIVDNNTVTVDADYSEVICTTNGNLTTSIPTKGTGIWTQITGTGSITDDTDNTTTVTGLNVGSNLFTWTLTEGGCSATQNYTINNNSFTILDSPDQDVCATTASISGQNVALSTGYWTVMAGPGVVANSTAFSTTVSSLAHSPTTNIFRWTIEKDGCSDFDDITVTNNQVLANAGSTPLATCGTTNNLSATAPIVGEAGTWTTQLGTGVADNSTLYNTTVSNLSPGENIFRWTLTHTASMIKNYVQLLLPTLPVIFQP